MSETVESTEAVDSDGAAIGAAGARPPAPASGDPSPPAGGRSGGRVRVLMTVTLNPNQLRSFLVPMLVLDEVESVTLVADVEPPPMPKLRGVVPPPLLVKLVGRAAAKLVVCLTLAIRERFDWVAGYNLVPHGLNALIVGRLTGTKTLFHMIGGPIELEGGGWRSDNAVLSRLPRPVPALERLLTAIVRAFTVVLTMGSDARELLIARGLRPDRVIAIPAIIDEARLRPDRTREPEYDLLTVAQLNPRKRIEDFLQAVAILRAERPGLRAAIAGEGPLEGELRDYATRLGIADAVDFLGYRLDIDRIYARSRIFVLTSSYEGLSLAITEAMASGLPVVVTDIGEVDDLVREGENGHLFEIADVGTLVDRVRRLLDDPQRSEELGAQGAADVRALCSPARLSGLFRELFARVR